MEFINSIGEAILEALTSLWQGLVMYLPSLIAGLIILIAVSDILKLGQFTTFLKDIAWYLPNVIIAVLILVVGFVLGYFVDDLIVKILKSTKAKLANLVGAVAKWAIIVF